MGRLDLEVAPKSISKTYFVSDVAHSKLDGCSKCRSLSSSENDWEVANRFLHHKFLSSNVG